MTVRIISVNAIALALLLVGTLYLGQYQKNLIEAKLETFETEVNLISASIAEGAATRYNAPSETKNRQYRLKPDATDKMVRRLGLITPRRILLFDREGQLLLDSLDLKSNNSSGLTGFPDTEDDTFYTIKIFKGMAGFILKLLPDRRVLPLYPITDTKIAADYPNVVQAIEGRINISAWTDINGRIFLSAAAPLIKNDYIIGAVLLTREGKDIEEDIAEVWINILRAFVATLIITILLSIYLSGAIARPLKKLANAAESVRKGKAKHTDIPDLSNRHDEIGELSIVLREMTEALWDRMDSIERFAADVAHELKNPLTSLRSAVETASIIKDKKDRDKLMDIIKHDIERLNRLINDISNASRLDSELSRESFKRVNLKNILQGLLDAYKDPLERNNTKNKKLKDLALAGDIEIHLDCTNAQNVFIWGLEGRLEQVFENLLANALSFSPENGMVFIKVIWEGRLVKIAIEDQGPGIPESKLENVFERFYSQRPEHESYGRHSGLGLSICKQIIAALNGEIYAENVKDRSGNIAGARFTVVLNTA